ncbi:hypothetical protein PPYR_03131 [Photinus pyralis]|uniref:Amine oxidase domain-containing protein n=1 Tax=Photinus pyralis TaxID=7054 RepID=A0A1Y1L2Y0_PHOPY|nr:spermine oxidase-like [Photinus pyralis]KAB0791331.1 hypothetical protein PPYR_03131 [Photinus pyralis]
MFRTLAFLIYVTYSSGVDCLNDPNVVIIGAGAAGISAAARLYRNGIKNVKVLEAGNRIGGRIHSLKFGESYIDLGAQWCHGEKNNAVYDLVRDLNVLKTNKIAPRLYHSKLKLVPKEFAEKFDEVFQDIYLLNSTKYEGSLGELMIDRFRKAAPKVWGKEFERNLAEECVDLCEKLVLCNDGAFSWFDLSAEIDYEISEGEQELGWNGVGFKTVLEVLMEGTPVSDNVVLNKEVSEIIQNGNGTVTVGCTDGTTYTADHTIVTVSLGVLKDRGLSLFKPELPREKLNAIEALGIAAVSSVFLHYPNRWWNDTFKGISFIWDKDEVDQTADKFPEGPAKGGRSWITAIVYILPVPRNPNVLSAWYVGEFVPQIEKTSSDTISSGITYTISLFLDREVPRPDKIVRHNWYSDPHFRGSYSYETMESRKMATSQAALLSQPLFNVDGRPVVLFAGEATNPIRYATVHGALETGYREADRIIDLYKT